jgi:hypothetical protein
VSKLSHLFDVARRSKGAPKKVRVALRGRVTVKQHDSARVSISADHDTMKALYEALCVVFAQK